MLYINTKITDNTIINVDDLFLLRYSDIIKTYTQNSYILKLLKDIEGMRHYEGDVLIAKYGSVSMKDISMGIKACILAILYSDEYVISSDEMGYNCIYALAEISKNTDIHIYSSAEYTDFVDGVDVIIDGIECHNKYDVIDTMEAMYE